ncbi:MAG TPA: Tex-like N-terminal domain-containing protein, partial [Ktedonobacterales bacterium]|nr:Tex-like N-terminal domain-containing protein [Ktedonobacterales bacterium]
MSDTPPVSGEFLSLDDLQFPETLEPAEVARVVAVELKLKPTQALATLTLLDDGNTVPFIARYRKEATGNLDEVQIQ